MHNPDQEPWRGRLQLRHEPVLLPPSCTDRTRASHDPKLGACAGRVHPQKERVDCPAAGGRGADGAIAMIPGDVSIELIEASRNIEDKDMAVQWAIAKAWKKGYYAGRDDQ